MEHAMLAKQRIDASTSIFTVRLLSGLEDCIPEDLLLHFQMALFGQCSRLAAAQGVLFV